MTYPRRSFGAVSLEVPPGLFEDDEAPPGFLVALTAIAPATLRIRTLAPGKAASLVEIMAGLCPSLPKDVTANGRKHAWPGLASAMPGDPHRVHYLFESGGKVFQSLAEAPANLWADYGPYLEGAMLSLDLGEKPRPSLPLHGAHAAPVVHATQPAQDPVEDIKRQLAAAEADVIRLILSSHFDEAEARLRTIDADIYGANALAHAYEAALERAPTDARIYDRALHWARSTFPDPHTAVEAEQFGAAIADAEERLRLIHQPD